MGQVLAEIPSASNPGKSYAIIQGRDGVVYCECWAWKKNRTCKHLDQFHESQLLGKTKAAPKKNLNAGIQEALNIIQQK